MNRSLDDDAVDLARSLLERAGFASADPVLERLDSGRSGMGSWRVSVGDEGYVLKIQPVERFEEHWAQSVTVQRCAAERGIAPAVFAVDEERRATLSELVHDVSLLSALQDPARSETMLVALAHRFADLHGLPIPDGVVPRSPVALSQSMLEEIESRHAVPGFAARAWQDFRARPEPTFEPVLCHNDPNPTNMLFDGERIVLVDWETAGVGDGWFDVASLLNMLVLEGPRQDVFVSAYVDRRGIESPSPARIADARRTAYLAYGTTFLHLAGQAGSDWPLDALPSLPQCYGEIGAGLLDIGTPAGRWRLGAANFAGYLALV